MISKNELRERLKGILVSIDMETTPNVGPFWRPSHQTSISHEQVVLERQIMSIQYKVCGSDKVTIDTWTMPTQRDLAEMRSFIRHLDCIPKYNRKAAEWLLASCAHTDKYMIEAVVDVFRNAQVLVHQNGCRFDLPWLKSRIWYHDMPPLNNMVSLDTLKLSRQNFNLNSHKLDYMAKFKDMGGKVNTKYDDWLAVMGGDKATLNDLCNVYGGHDVDLVEDVLLSMLPHCDNIPVHLGMLITENRNTCPKCGGRPHRHDHRTTAKGHVRQRWRCVSCGATWTDGRALSTTDKIDV